MMPERPPIVKSPTRPTAKWSAVVVRIVPPQSVASQLKIFTPVGIAMRDRKSTRLNSSHDQISYAVFCLKKKNRPCVAFRRATDRPFPDATIIEHSVEAHLFAYYKTQEPRGLKPSQPELYVVRARTQHIARTSL